jgi:hypothetical protein
MDRAIPIDIAEGLGGTDNNLTELLDELGVSTASFQVEVELEHRLAFGYCQGCFLWCGEVRDDLCALCREEGSRA